MSKTTPDTHPDPTKAASSPEAEEAAAQARYDHLNQRNQAMVDDIRAQHPDASLAEILQHLSESGGL